MQDQKPTPLARWLLRSGMKQKELAAQAGVSEVDVSRAKRGRNGVPESAREKLKEATGLKRL